MKHGTLPCIFGGAFEPRQLNSESLASNLLVFVFRDEFQEFCVGFGHGLRLLEGRHSLGVETGDVEGCGAEILFKLNAKLLMVLPKQFCRESDVGPHRRQTGLADFLRCERYRPLQEYNQEDSVFHQRSFGLRMEPLSGEVNMLICLSIARQCKTQSHNRENARRSISSNEVESVNHVRLLHMLFVKWMHLLKQATFPDQRTSLIEGSNAQEKDFAGAA
jgi:hypothetical protein